MKRVVILGAGFAGIWAARSLSRARVEITVIDRNNYHTFLPLLYQVGSAEIEPAQIAYPIRSMLRRLPAARFIRAEATGIDLEKKFVVCDAGIVPYDYLIVATGSETNYFGVPGADRYAFPLKTLDEGVVLRIHILSCFERASLEPDAATRKRLLSFAIVGGGPTGIECAGALMELINGPLRRDYPDLDFDETSVFLLDAGPSVLPSFDNSLSEYTRRKLNRMGVRVMLNAPVSEVTARGLRLGGGGFLESSTVIWTAGVCGGGILGRGKIASLRGNRISVRPSLQLPDHGEVYVVGDLSGAQDASLPMIAPVAIQQGVAAAQNILRQIEGMEPLPFRYRDRGAMVTIGRNSAVAAIAGWRFKGFFAWTLWLLIHLMNLIGFRNKILVLINWAWNYLFFERAVRLILPACCDNPLGRPCVRGDGGCEALKPRRARGEP